MTMSKLRRLYPSLIRMVEKQAHSKFKRKPSLHFVPGGRPRTDIEIITKGKRVLKVTKSVILIPKRMARENEVLTKLSILHELRDNLAYQNGNADSKAHLIAKRAEKTFRKKLGVKKRVGWLLRQHYGWQRKRRGIQLDIL